MDVRILGPLYLRYGTAHGRLTAAKPRKVLALLLVHADQVVPVGSLARELWRGPPPAGAAAPPPAHVPPGRRALRGRLGRPARPGAARGPVACSRRGGVAPPARRPGR